MWIIEFEVAAEHDGTLDDLKGLLLVAYRALRENASLVSSHMWATIEEGEVNFRVIVDEEDRDTARRCASAGVRDALHAAGAGTPGWVERTEQLIAALGIATIVSKPAPALV